MSKPVIIGFPQSTYVWTARAALNLKGVDYDFQPIGPADAKTPEHLARHPYGKVPAFQHGDVALYETAAICHYVDSAFEGPALVPADPVAGAHVHRWVSFTNAYLYGPCVPQLALQYIFPRGADGGPDRAAIEAGLPALKKAVGLVDAGMGGGRWLVGDGITLADLFVGPLLFVIKNFPEGAAALEEAPNALRLMGALAETPAVMAAAPRR